MTDPSDPHAFLMLSEGTCYDERGLARVRTVEVVPEAPVTDLRDVSRALHPAHRARTRG